jgi:hypothetical protein
MFCKDDSTNPKPLFLGLGSFGIKKGLTVGFRVLKRSSFYWKTIEKQRERNKRASDPYL